jgi:hemerythrin-like domain-containing protein
MDSISDVLTRNHQHCDQLFARAEAAVSHGDMESARSAFADFRAALERHLRAEEEILFPAFEARTGSTLGPTEVMRQEHEMMRTLLRDMESAVAASDAARYLGLSETLLTLMQQHNMKEESVLYRMAENALASDSPRMLARLAEAGIAAAE